MSSTVYTLTLNASLDYHVAVNKIQLGGLNLAENAHINCGGKGINVSKVLKTLQANTMAIAVTAGFTGQQVQQSLHNMGVPHKCITLKEGLTRINVKLHDHSNRQETEINGTPLTASPEEEQQILNTIAGLVTKDDILVMSGSIIKPFPTNIYQKIARMLPEGTKTVLDTRGDMLTKNIHNNFLIKPNLFELQQCANKDLTTVKEIADTARNFFIDKGIQNVLISMGAKGSMLVTQTKIYQAEPVVVNVCNSVAAGDSMVAGFLAG